MSRSNCRLGFTVVELTIALAVLFVIGGVGSQVDLVDLVDKEEYLSEHGIDLDTASLIGKLNVEHAEGDAFLVQVLCAELGNLGSTDALQKLEELADHKDYFVAKRAKVAMDRIKATGTKQKPDSLERVRAMLPEKAMLAFDSKGDFKSNLENSKNLYRPTIPNETLMTVQNKIGNAQVDSLQIVALNEDRKSFLVLGTGHFYQTKVSDTLEQLAFQEVHAGEQTWVGSAESMNSKVQIALNNGRTFVAEIGLGEPFMFDPTKLMEVAVELDNEYLPQ